MTLHTVWGHRPPIEKTNSGTHCLTGVHSAQLWDGNLSFYLVVLQEMPNMFQVVTASSGGLHCPSKRNNSFYWQLRTWRWQKQDEGLDVNFLNWRRSYQSPKDIQRCKVTKEAKTTFRFQDWCWNCDCCVYIPIQIGSQLNSRLILVFRRFMGYLSMRC